MSRSPLVIGMMAATAFVVVGWAVRGFPIHPRPSKTVGELQPSVTSTFGGEEYRRREAEKLSRRPARNQQLDQVRRDLMQAALQYTETPCDARAKRQLIDQLTVYTQQWQQALDCPRPFNMLLFCSEARLEEVAANFSTPTDVALKDALDKAFEQKGIVESEFPSRVRFDVRQFAGPEFWFDPSPVCRPMMKRASNTP